MTDLETALKKLKHTVFGASVHAFGRLGCEKIFPTFRIVCLQYTDEIKCLRREGIEVFCLEELMKKKPRGKRNPSTALKSIAIQNRIENSSRENTPLLILYKSSPYIEKLCRRKGWIPAANSFKIYKKLESKTFFRSLLRDLHIEGIPGQALPLNKLEYKKLIAEYPAGFVVQKPVSGGGGGTFFIKNAKSFRVTIDTLTKSPDVKPSSRLLISKFIKGYSPSVTGCVTRKGILQLSPQLQLIDIKEVYSKNKGNGVFCGHDWSAAQKIPGHIQQKMRQVVDLVGVYLQKKSYKGIFGIDFLVDDKSGEVYPVELNPRLLGTFPVSTFVQQKAGELPLIAFHALEFAGQEYGADISVLNRAFAKGKEGSHLFLFAPFKPCRTMRPLRAGVYSLNKKQELSFLRTGYSLCDLKNKNEFLIIDGTLNKQKVMRKSGPLRILRIVSLSQISSNMGRELNAFGTDVVRAVYSYLRITSV